jgi:thiol-disulfide isomerase/thioredoxin
MGKSRPGRLSAALSAAAGLGYVAYRTVGPTGELAGEAETPAATAPALAVATLPDFTLATLTGEQQSIKSWPGKPMLINFWATWCGPCLREIPMLKELQTARPDLQVVGIAIEKPEPVVEFAGNMQFNYPILIGQNEAWAAAAALGVNIYALPFTVFTGADGSILGVHTGELHAEHLEAFRSVNDDLAAGRIGVDEARARIAASI